MSEHDNDTCPHLVRAILLEAENARLKEEVKLLTAEVSFDKRDQLHVDKLVAEFTQCQVEKLKAEVERLRASSFVTAVPVEQYERVIKAGDAMAKVIDDDYLNTLQVWIDWNAAKEGKQP